MAKYGLERRIPTTKQEDTILYCCYDWKRCNIKDICCYYCTFLYKCQEGRCINVIFSMTNQPKPRPFSCQYTLTLTELTWRGIFRNTGCL